MSYIISYIYIYIYIHIICYFEAVFVCFCVKLCTFCTHRVREDMLSCIISTLRPVQYRQINTEFYTFTLEIPICFQIPGNQTKSAIMM